MRFELRPYQVEAVDKIVAAAEAGVRRQLGVAATGLGKTIIFCALAERLGCRTLILAHRDELISQAAAKVREVWPGADVGIVKASDNGIRNRVVVASVQTLARERRLQQLVSAYRDESVLMKRPDPFGLVVVDEAHHAAADSYRSILDGLRAGQECAYCVGGSVLSGRYETDPGDREPCEDCSGTGGGPLLLGVTATPDRGDGQGLDDLFEQISWTYDILWGIRSGYLCDLRGLRVQLDRLDMSAVKVRRGDYEAGAAGRALDNAGAPTEIVKAWQEHASDRQTLVFTPTVELARHCAEEFTAAGVRAAMVCGETPVEERRQILDDYSHGRVQVVANCAVLTEGYDEPSTGCIVIARPTRSRALYTQMVGRGTRRHPDKTDCLVLDVVSASSVHSLVTVPSLFGMNGKHAKRLSNGSGAVTEVLDEYEQQEVAAGRLKAEEADLFHNIRGRGIAWVVVPDRRIGGFRYVRPLGRGEPTVVIAKTEAESEQWLAGVSFPQPDEDGKPVLPRKQVLIRDVSMETAQAVAEDYLRKSWRGPVTNLSAGWRAGRPSAKALAAAKTWRVKVDPTWNAGQLSDELTAVIARADAKAEERKRNRLQALK